MPTAHELTNGRYRVQLTDAGCGQSFWDWIALNRRPGDEVEDAHGFFIYLRDLDDGRLWSSGLCPTATKPESYQVHREQHRFAIERRDHGIAVTMEVTLSATDDVEIRCLRLCNESQSIRHIEVTSYLEVALAHPMGDLGHPAFSKLFVQTEFIRECGALVARRRPRSGEEAWPAMFHALSGVALQAWESDRAVFLGRGRTAADPAFVMTGSTGNVLDPVMSLRATVEIPPGGVAELRFLLGAVADHAKVTAVVRRHLPATAPCECEVSFPPKAKPCPAGNAPPLKFFNGFGGFSEDGHEYVIPMPLEDGGLRVPPMPWCNVIANEHFGFITSETGAGCTWSRNSQANRLTPWSNDPVSDPHGEAIYLRDEDRGVFWSPLPGPCPPAADYETAHGLGYTRCRVTAHELNHETTLFVPRTDPVKLVRLRVENLSPHARNLSLFSYQQLVLGTLPPAQRAITTRRDDTALLASNPASADFSDGTAFAFGVLEGVKVTQTSMSCDRRVFIGDNGSVRSPRALGAVQLDGNTETADDACFAQHWRFTLAPKEVLDCCLILGEAVGDNELKILAERYRHLAMVDAALNDVTRFWRERLRALRVRTPVPGIDLMVNGWLAYQTIACRMWGRTAFYQSSGAFGFRDQLQDAGNLTLLWPELTRRQILLHAQHQFVEGDVLHWWHERPVERGVRTRFSDDLLWLPYVASEYVRATGDVALLDEAVPFLEALPLKPDEAENYLKPTTSARTASVLEHCCLAIDRSLTCGAHGLPLMGTGDWNDGMNRVGREGRGESVWLGFFLFEILGNFIPLVAARGDSARADCYEAFRHRLLKALNTAGWDGGWYRRAYYDDGTPLGASTAGECRIDGLAQSWAVLSGAAPAERATMAMDAAEQQLISMDDGLIRLLTPPFVNTAEDPGYIKGYVAGVRENGGQYTHAACWMVRAMAKLGRRDRAAHLLEMLSPLWHTRTIEDVARYKVEPFVIAADVYGAPPHVGRGGWTWYTGSAAWAYRVAVESVLGLRVEGGSTLVLRPCVPDAWPSYHLEYQPPGTGSLLMIDVLNPSGCAEGVVAVEMDGEAISVHDHEARLPLPQADGIYNISIILGAKAR